MSRVRVKICGITRREDADLAVQLGADALGFVFWSGSPRRVSPSAAAAITAGVPASVARVGVFVDEPAASVREIVQAAGLDAVQLHGSENPGDYRIPGVTIIKAFDLAGDDDVARAIALPRRVTPLIDARDPERKGGTGRRADWARAAEVAKVRAMLLAGGLTADTVRDAVTRVRPWAVDVSSGVESAPGVKDPGRLRAFFAAVHAIDAELEAT